MTKIIYVSVFVLIFALGWIVSSVYSSYPNQEIPLSTLFVSSHKSAPYNRVQDSQIFVNGRGLTLRQERLSLAHYAPTGSMLPFITEGHTGIEIPASDTEIHVGDIVAYRPKIDPSLLVVHQVVDIKQENGERCYIMKGFNNLVSDGCVKENQLEFVLIGVLF